MAVSDKDVADAYAWALGHAAHASRGRCPDLAEAIHDAATDGVVWAVESFDPSKVGRGGFASFSASAVRRCVKRALYQWVNRERPDVFSIDADGGPEPESNAAVQPLTMADLPEDLAFTVRLYMVDGYSLREVGVLTGVGPNVVQRKLRKAAELLAPGRVKPQRKAGERRLGRVNF